MVDSAVMMHGYAILMRTFNDSIVESGLRAATSRWRDILSKFSPKVKYRYSSWSGDLFDKRNPLWQRAGVVKPSRDGRSLTVLNTGAAQSETGRILLQLATVGKRQKTLAFLVTR